MKRINHSHFFGKSKKGNAVLDSLVIIIVLVTMAIIGIFSSQIMQTINTSIQSSNLNTAGKTSLATNTAQSSSVFDGIYVTVFVLMWALLLFGSYNISTKPAIFALFLILFAIVIFVGLALANAADAIANDTLLSQYANTMPMTLFIIDHFALVIVFVITSVALTLWGKSIFDATPY